MQRASKWLWLHFKQHRLGNLELIAFCIGYALMAFELVASRILAPAIGSSTYVWTSVIGVIIGALALGYAFGGFIADKRVKHTDIALLLLSGSVAMALCLVSAPGFLSILTEISQDARLRGLLASLGLFAPASFILGAVSPYLVRLHTQGITQTGRSVASLSALNALGGIAGTFSVGFFFFGYIGSQQTLAFICLLVLLASWAVVPKKQTRMRLAVSAATILLIVTVFLPIGTSQAVSIDSATSHYEVITTTDRQGHPVRYLVIGNQGVQSGVRLDAPRDLALPYAQQMASFVQAAPQKQRILVLGGGAFSLPGYLAQTYPSSSVDVVEIDPTLVDIAHKYFFLQDRPNLHIHREDARTFLNSNQQRYDIIIVDVFSELSVPFTLTTTEYAHALASKLQPNGTVLVNAIISPSDSCREFTGRILASYQSALPWQRVFAEHWGTPIKQNTVLVYGRQPLSWKMPALTEITDRVPSGAAPFSDNHAPVERLQFNCR